MLKKFIIIHGQIHKINMELSMPPIHTNINLSTSMIIHKIVFDLLRNAYVDPYSLVYYF